MLHPALQNASFVTVASFYGGGLSSLDCAGSERIYLETHSRGQTRHGHGHGFHYRVISNLSRYDLVQFAPQNTTDAAKANIPGTVGLSLDDCPLPYSYHGRLG